MNPLAAETTESSEIFCPIWTRQHVTSVDLQICTTPPDFLRLVSARPGGDVSDWRSGNVEHFDESQETSLPR